MKKIFALLLILALVCFTAGCGSSEEAEEEYPYTIGIATYGENSALAQCRKGMNDTLEELGFVKNETMDVIGKNADSNLKTAQQNADSLVAQDVDLICAFSTPMAQSALKAAKDTTIPVVFGGVTDPKSAGLDQGNITGVAVDLPVEKQLAMIRAMLPDAQSLGIIYCETEDNSLYAMEQYKALAADYGFEIKERAIQDVNDLYLASDDLILEVDCITTIPDNIVESGLGIVLKKAEALAIPVFGNDLSQVRSGCVAAVAVDYRQVGVEMGKMVAKILNGEISAADLDFKSMVDTELYYNPDTLDALQLTLPQDLEKDALDMNEVSEEEEKTE